jgi:hypothetical protein
MAMDLHYCPRRLRQRVPALSLAAAVLAGIPGCTALLGIEELDRAPDASAAADGNVGPAPDAGSGPLPPGEIVWVRSLGNMSAYSIVKHPTGSLLIAGSINETVDLGGGPLIPFGEADMVLAEFDASNAEHLWSTRFGDIGSEYAFLGGTPFDSAGDVFVHGVTYGTADLGLGSVAGAGLADTFVGRYPWRGGPPAWLQRIATAEEDKFLAVVPGPGDSIFVSGYFVGSVTLGDQVLTSAGSRDILLYRLAGADGQVLMARSWGGLGLDEGNVIVWTGSHLILSGRFEQSLAFGTEATDVLTSEGNRDVYVAKLEPDGTQVWAVRFGGSGYEDGTAHVDPAGNIYVYGAFENQIAFGAVNLTSAGGQDIFLAKLDPDGNVLWARSWGGPVNDSPVGLAFDAEGTIVITGWISGDFDLGSGVVTSQGGIDTFVASYDPTAGEHRWSHVFGTSGDDRAWGVMIDAGLVYALVQTAIPMTWSPPLIGHMVDPTAVLLAISR